MNRLGVMLAELNLSQYHLTLATAAYGTWEDVMNITDNDLKALGIRPGIRRLLQRRIAQEYGVHEWQSIPYLPNGAVARPPSLAQPQPKLEDETPTPVGDSPIPSIETSTPISTTTERFPRPQTATPRGSHGRRRQRHPMESSRLARRARNAALANNHPSRQNPHQSPPSRPTRSMAARVLYVDAQPMAAGMLSAQPMAFATYSLPGSIDGSHNIVPNGFTTAVTAVTDFAVATSAQPVNDISFFPTDMWNSPISQNSYSMTGSLSDSSEDTFTSFAMSDASFGGGNYHYYHALPSASLLDFNNAGHMADYEFTSNSFFTNEQPSTFDFSYTAPPIDGTDLFAEAFHGAFEQPLLGLDEMSSCFVSVMAPEPRQDINNPSAGMLPRSQ